MQSNEETGIWKEERTYESTLIEKEPESFPEKKVSCLSLPRWRYTLLSSVLVVFIVIGISISFVIDDLKEGKSEQEKEYYNRFRYSIQTEELPLFFKNAVEQSNVTFLAGCFPLRVGNDSILWVFTDTRFIDENGKERSTSSSGIVAKIEEDGMIREGSFLKEEQNGRIAPLVEAPEGEKVVILLRSGVITPRTAFLDWQIQKKFSTYRKSKLILRKINEKEKKLIHTEELLQSSYQYLEQKLIPIATFFNHQDGFYYSFLQRTIEEKNELIVGRFLSSQLEEPIPDYLFWNEIEDKFENISLLNASSIFSNWNCSNSSLSIRWNSFLKTYSILFSKDGTLSLFFSEKPWKRWSQPIAISHESFEDNKIVNAFLHHELWRDEGREMVLSVMTDKGNGPKLFSIKSTEKTQGYPLA